MQLPVIKDDSQNLMLIQTKWKSILDPLLGKPLSSSNILTNIALSSGNTVINHLLGRKPQGWMITDINGAATIYRSAAFNDLTLTLNSSAGCTVNLLVF